ncbi:haloalkane dehalogenase [Maricurvus nonylphenolicus]
MDFKRTPDDRFDNLVDFNFAPNYLYVDDTEGGKLRVHYLDEGPVDGDVVLLMHGQPAWCYLYRHMIPLLVDEGFRVIAPDLVGMGRSDKPTKAEDYTYARHVTWMSDWLTQLDINNVTVFFQDWGSLIGLRLVAAFPDQFAHVVLANGALPVGKIPVELTDAAREIYQSLPVVGAENLKDIYFDKSSPVPPFLYWRKFCAECQDLDVGFTMAKTAHKSLSEMEAQAYSAPFPDESYLKGPRTFPSLVPIFHDDMEVEENKAAWESLSQFDKPFMCAFSDGDPVTAGGDQPFLESVPGCSDVQHRVISDAGHFLQQDQPEQCVKAILDVRRSA